jgi:hypothetical protein
LLLVVLIPVVTGVTQAAPGKSAGSFSVVEAGIPALDTTALHVAAIVARLYGT